VQTAATPKLPPTTRHPCMARPASEPPAAPHRSWRPLHTAAVDAAAARARSPYTALPFTTPLHAAAPQRHSSCWSACSW
jgi:hypothetical protein